MKEKFVIKNMQNGFYATELAPYTGIMWYDHIAKKNKLIFDSEDDAIKKAEKIKELESFQIEKYLQK